jgi:surface polysaccharide O-acyltransferase-like enzyme
MVKMVYGRSMIVEPEVSYRIKILRFPLIVGVIFIHAYGSRAEFSGLMEPIGMSGDSSFYIRYYIFHVLGRICVPFLFMQSGFLFFSHLDLSWEGYRAKIKSRLRTLVLPYILWNLLVLFVIGVIQSNPVTVEFCNSQNKPIWAFSVFEYFDAVLGITQYPIAGHLWFVRDLIVITLVAPVFYYINGEFETLVTIILLGIWLFSLWPLHNPGGRGSLLFLSRNPSRPAAKRYRYG